jgi:hypothetical protein
MTAQEILKIVSDLNCEIGNQTGYDHLNMEYRDDGFSIHIVFLGGVVWSANDDYREYLDDGETLEPLDVFLRREIRQEIVKLIPLWADQTI